MTARAHVQVFLRDADGIEAEPIPSRPGVAVVVLGEWSFIDLHVDNVRSIDRLIGALMDARRIVAPDDDAALVQIGQGKPDHDHGRAVTNLGGTL